MLIITRHPGERIMLGEDIVVEVLEVAGSTVRVGIQAPRSIPVYREEIWERRNVARRSPVPATGGRNPHLPRPHP